MMYGRCFGPSTTGIMWAPRYLPIFFATCLRRWSRFCLTSRMPTVIWVGRRSVIGVGCRMGSRTTSMVVLRAAAADDSARACPRRWRRRPRRRPDTAGRRRAVRLESFVLECARRTLALNGLVGAHASSEYNHARAHRCRLGTPDGTLACGFRSAPQRPGALLGNVGADGGALPRQGGDHRRVVERLRDFAGNLRGAMGHGNRGPQRADLLRPLALHDGGHARPENGIDSPHHPARGWSALGRSRLRRSQDLRALPRELTRISLDLTVARCSGRGPPSRSPSWLHHPKGAAVWPSSSSINRSPPIRRPSK